MKDVLEAVARQRFDKDVDVIGHDDPGIEHIAAAVKVTQGPFDQRRNRRSGKETRARSLIEPRFDALGEAALEFLAGCLVPWLGMVFEKGCFFAVPGFEKVARHGVGKAEGHEGSGSLLIAVGQITAGLMIRRIAIKGDESPVGGRGGLSASDRCACGCVATKRDARGHRTTSRMLVATGSSKRLAC